MVKTVWVLADDRMGNVNQLLGVAEHLSWPFERKDIAYDKWVRLPNFMRGASCLGVQRVSRLNLEAPWPDVVLSAGRRTFPVACFIKKASGGHTKIVQLMHPGVLGIPSADLIVLPEHDGYRGHLKNIMTVCGTAHRITPQRLEQEQKKWDSVFRNYPHPRVSVIVGGATKNKPFTPEMASVLVQSIRHLNPKSVLVTTSRRTPAAVEDVLKTQLPAPLYFYQFGDASENPYFGLLACADKIVVTGDSMSMCSECCASQKPVYIFAPDEMMSEKHKRFHKTLYEKKAVFNVLAEDVSDTSFNVLKNPAEMIADRIKSLFPDERQSVK